MNKKTIFTIAKYLLALMFIVFGANKLIGFMEMPPPANPVAGLFMEAMFGSFLAKLVAITEILAGVLLLIPKTTFIGLLLLSAVLINIIGFHVAHDFPGNPFWFVAIILFILACIPYKDKFNDLQVTN